MIFYIVFLILIPLYFIVHKLHVYHDNCFESIQLFVTTIGIQKSFEVSGGKDLNFGEWSRESRWQSTCLLKIKNKDVKKPQQDDLKEQNLAQPSKSMSEQRIRQ